jgi:signal transduction histidine kinase
MRQFTAMLVHDLRAPLTAMKWSIQLLQENNVSKEDRVEMYNDLASETQSLVKRVNEMLDVSKIDAGKFTVKTKKGDVSVIAREVVKDFTILAKKRGLEISLFAQEELPKAEIDAEKIQQVLQNLISNAIKYTESGSVHVAVLHEKSTNSIRVEVKDTGIGISPNDQKHLFIPFSAPPTGEHTGEVELVSTGLGLAIVKGIIEAHNGTVGVISKKGKGTTFWFEIPLG